jgi:hypothetical protein
MLMVVSETPYAETNSMMTDNELVFLAFGIFARVLPDSDEFLALRAQNAGVELADSITVDGHKILNVVRNINPAVLWVTRYLI